MKGSFYLFLLLSLPAISAADTKPSNKFCITKKSMVVAARKVGHDIKDGIHQAKENIKLMENGIALPLLSKTAEYERSEAAHSIKVATVDTVHAVKETAKAKFQNIKSQVTQKKAKSSRAQAVRHVKHATADTAEVIEKKIKTINLRKS